MNSSRKELLKLALLKRAYYAGYPVSGKVDDMSMTSDEEKAYQSNMPPRMMSRQSPEERRQKRVRRAAKALGDPRGRADNLLNPEGPGGVNTGALDRLETSGQSDTMGQLFKGSANLRALRRRRMTPNWCASKDEDCTEGGGLPTNAEADLGGKIVPPNRLSVGQKGVTHW